MMENAFYLILKIFCSDFLNHFGKRLDKKAKVNLKSYDATAWKTNNCNTHIAQHRKK